MGHIELARWAEPRSRRAQHRHFMGLLAAGLAPDLLTTVCLATTAPVVLAPAMNQAMWVNAAVQANRAVLESRGVRFLGPAQGDQACGETGPGRMLEPGDDRGRAARDARATAPANRSPGSRSSITAGPTREPIDPVRYITNRSSGKMGFALAAAASEAGANGRARERSRDSRARRPGVRRVDVETAEEMYNAVHAEIAGTDIFIACAAVSDYRPQAASRQKIKRSAEEIELPLVRSPGHTRKRRGAVEAAVHRRVCSRDAGCREARSREARQEARRHDRSESGRPRLRVRSRDEYVGRFLARRRASRSVRARNRCSPGSSSS